MNVQNTAKDQELLRKCEALVQNAEGYICEKQQFTNKHFVKFVHGFCKLLQDEFNYSPDEIAIKSQINVNYLYRCAKDDDIPQLKNAQLERVKRMQDALNHEIISLKEKIF